MYCTSQWKAMFILFSFISQILLFQIANCQKNCNAVDIWFSLNFIGNRSVSVWNSLRICFSNSRRAATQKAELQASPARNQSTTLHTKSSIRPDGLQLFFYFHLFLIFLFLFFHITSISRSLLHISPVKHSNTSICDCRTKQCDEPHLAWFYYI